MNRLLLAATVLFPLVLQGPGSAALAADATPAAPISALDAGLMATMKAAATKSFPARFAALGPVVDHSFDLATVLKLVVGLRWASLPADQQTSLLAAFRAFTIASYVSNFKEDDGTHFVTLPDQRNVGSDVVVSTQIVPASGDPTRIDYVMRQEADGWHAVDVLLEGTISQAAVQRSDFRSLLDDNSASRLIASLRQKINDLSGGSVQG